MGQGKKNQIFINGGDDLILMKTQNGPKILV